MRSRTLRWMTAIGFAGALYVSAAAAHVGTGIAVDRHGRVWVADTSGNYLWRIETNGKPTRVAAEIHSNLLSLAPDDGVYVENDRHTNRWPAGLLHVDSQGRVSSANDSSEAKELMEMRALAERSGLSNVNSMVRGGEGSVFVRASNSLYRVAPGGRPTELQGAKEAAFLGSGEADCRRSFGLAVGDDASLYIANYGKSSVFRIKPSGTTETILHSSWPWVPTGIAVAGNTLYVLERFGHPYGVVSNLTGTISAKFRVQRIERDGRRVLLATLR